MCEICNFMACLKLVQVKDLEQMEYNHYLQSPPEWDPFMDNESNALSMTAKVRIKRDLLTLFNEPPPGVYVVGDEQNLKIVHAIIVGVMNTPYEGGFFYFVLKCPNEYPMHPPKVKFMTTDAGRVAFNPNLYKCGKVCLSILGTWSGPAWSPAQQLSSVLMSIQSLLNEKPYHNEPGFEEEQNFGDVETYNEIITYETLRVAVCGMLENECRLCVPNQLKGIMKDLFLALYDIYKETARKKLHLDSKIVFCPFTYQPVRLEYKKLLERLENIHASIIQQLSGPTTYHIPLTDGDVTEDCKSDGESKLDCLVKGSDDGEPVQECFEVQR